MPAGERNMPDPMAEPARTATALNSPSFLGRARRAGSDLLSGASRARSLDTVFTAYRSLNAAVSQVKFVVSSSLRCGNELSDVFLLKLARLVSGDQ